MASPGSISLPADVQRQINAICLRFEESCQAGPPWPRLEDFLTGADGPVRAALLRELLALELHYRQAAGEPVSLAEYQERFPGHDAMLQALLPTATSTCPERPSSLDGASSDGQRPGDAPLTPPAGTGDALRFRVRRLHAKGGLGEVHVAEDTELRRAVALKRLQPEHATHAGSVQRFLREAEITARLEHPGIVPVYGLVRDAAGQPAYAMRFVQGDTLKEAIASYHQAPTRLAFRQLLGQFVAACNAVAYAHSRGVIHRDLKPANILVGQFGETLVVDWGLAKVVGRTEPGKADAEGTLTTAEQTLGDATQMGQAVGTPAYMAPEQAAGRWDVVGPAVDLYSLGATLYQLLTGQPPFQGENKFAILAAVQRGAFLPPRQVKRDVPAALAAVCQKALALEPGDRYATAQALAADVEHWLADEPVSAYREPLPARVRRWARRHKPLVASLAAVVLTAVVLGGGAAWWVHEQRQARLAEAVVRQRDAERQSGFAMEQAQKALAEGWDKQDTARLAEARAEADKAVTLARGGAGDVVRATAEALRAEAQAKTAQTEQNHRLRAALLDVTEPHETKTYQRGESGQAMALAQPTSDEQFAAAFRRWGMDVEREPAEQVTARLGAQPAAVVQEVVAGLDEWAQVRRQAKRPEGDWRRLSEVADRLDGDPHRRHLRRLRESGVLQRERLAMQVAQALVPWPAGSEVLPGPSHRQLRELAGRIDPAREPVLGVVALARALAVAGDARGAEGVYRAALATRPDEVVLLEGLSQLLAGQRPPRWAEAIECYRAARSLRPQLGIALGRALAETHRAGEAETVMRDLVRRQPDNPEMQLYLGRALYAQKKYGEAESACRKAIELQPDNATTYYNLGVTLSEQKKHREAEAAYRKAIVID